MNVLFAILLLVGSTNTYGFNWDKCRRHSGAPGAAGLTSSTTQFTSSWGACSMLGAIEQQKKRFITFNLDELKADSARGGGEYAEAYATLSGCSEGTSMAFAGVLQQNFTQIYGDHANRDPEAVYSSIEQIISRDSVLSNECKSRDS